MRATPGFHVVAVTIDPGGRRPYDEREWRDALVMIRHGRVELESVTGSRWPFALGTVIWLGGLPLRALHNPGPEPAQLIAISRR